MTVETPAASGDARGFLPLCRIKKRSDFLRIARSKLARMPGFIVQGRSRGDDNAPRVGFTCSKKVGNAVARNRAKRRLREIARLDLPTCGRPGWDYVLIGRRDMTGNRDFTLMRAEFRAALRRLHE